MSELVDEDGEREAGAEPEAVDSPVDAEEGGEAEQEFEFEEQEEYGFGFGEQDEDGSEGAEPFGPFGLRGWGRIDGVDAGVEGEDASLNPLGLL